MTESNQGPATPGTAARCEHADIVSTGRDASGIEWGRCKGCGDSTFVIDDPTPNPDGIRCGTFQPRPPGWEHPHMIEPESGWPEGSGFLSCAPEDCPTCLKRKVAVLESLRESREERDAALSSANMLSEEATRNRAEYRAAEQRNTEMEGALREGLAVADKKLNDVWGEGMPPYAEAYGYLSQAVRAALHDEERSAPPQTEEK